jgi:hypothetical protein
MPAIESQIPLAINVIAKGCSLSFFIIVFYFNITSEIDRLNDLGIGSEYPIS